MAAAAVRLPLALLSGAGFGLGLVLSGMTDTRRVQGWLDVAGNWDPTLAFVLGGAILPMGLAWAIAARRPAALTGTPFPAKPSTHLDAPLILGSVVFGIGWALAGLCPGPAAASLSFGGAGGVLFLLGMLAGMLAAPAARRWIDSAGRRGKEMDIRKLTETYAVSPQIGPDDLAAVKAAGFVRVICNRPDAEIPPEMQSEVIRKGAEALGLGFDYIPITPGQFDEGLVARQKAAMSAAGPVFAYCASGNRCTVVWALTQAGTASADTLIGTAARAGYNLEAIRPRL